MIHICRSLYILSNIQIYFNLADMTSVCSSSTLSSCAEEEDSSSSEDMSSNSTKSYYEFSFQDIVKEQLLESGAELYCIRFCDNIPSLCHYFVAVGSNTISIYRIAYSNSSDDTDACELIYRIIDEDFDDMVDEDAESFYACTWASTLCGNPVIAAAGRRGIIKVCSMAGQELGVMLGHGDSINELRTHTVDDGLIFSASKDRSVRMWNVRSLLCIAIFAGEGGHRDEALSLDVHLLGNCLVSSSMDTSIKVWNLLEPNLVNAIKNSDNSEGNVPMKIHTEEMPIFSTSQLHAGYVDSIRWVGDALLSKSTNNRAVLWTLDGMRYKGAPAILQEYRMEATNIWFIRLDVCLPLGIFAMGDIKANIQLFSTGPDIATKVLKEDRLKEKERYQYSKYAAPIKLLSMATHSNVEKIARHTSFSTDCKYLVAAFQDGTIQLWSINRGRRK